MRYFETWLDNDLWTSCGQTMMYPVGFGWGKYCTCLCPRCWPSSASCEDGEAADNAILLTKVYQGCPFPPQKGKGAKENGVHSILSRRCFDKDGWPQQDVKVLKGLSSVIFGRWLDGYLCGNLSFWGPHSNLKRVSCRILRRLPIIFICAGVRSQLAILGFLHIMTLHHVWDDISDTRAERHTFSKHPSLSSRTHIHG